VTGRSGALVVGLVLVCVGLAGGAGAVGADAAKRSVAADGGSARSAQAACAKRTSRAARARCRRARAAAAYRRGPRRGRAVLAPVAGARPGATRPGAGAPSGPSGSPAPAPGPGAPPPPPAPVASSVGAEAYDFGAFVLRLTRTSVPAGDLTIYFRNYDVGEHNLWLDAPASTGRAPLMISEAVGEGGGATKTVPVTPGTWRLYCSLDGHGVMTRDLAVQ